MPTMPKINVKMPTIVPDWIKSKYTEFYELAVGTIKGEF